MAGNLKEIEVKQRSGTPVNARLAAKSRPQK
jgi:hypothetical protein